MVKTITEETREPCSWCGGRGQRISDGYSTTSPTIACPRCTGTGQILTKTVTRTETYDLDELAAAVGERLLGALRLPDRPAEPGGLPVIHLEDE